MTSRFILNKFDLDLSSSGLLVCFGLFVVVVVLSCAVDCIMVVDERVICDGGDAWLGVSWGGVSGVHIEGALALSHCG